MRAAGVADDDRLLLGVGYGPTARSTPYEATCGGGTRGAGAVSDNHVGGDTGVSGTAKAVTLVSAGAGVAAVQDWHPHAMSPAASVGAAATSGEPASGAEAVADETDCCIPAISPRIAHAMGAFPNAENSEP